AGVRGLALATGRAAAPAAGPVRCRSGRRRAGRGAGRHLLASAPRGAARGPGRGPARGAGLARSARCRRRVAALPGRARAAAARRAVPPRSAASGGAGGAARSRTHARAGMDGGPPVSLSGAWAQFAGLGWPWALLALPLPWLLRRLLPPARRSGPALRVPWAGRLARVAASPGGRGGSAGGMPWLAWLAWALVCLAAARPLAWGEAVQPPQAARELMLAVDLSASMGERDMWM